MARKKNHRTVSRMTKRARMRRKVKLAQLFCLLILGALLMVGYVWQRVWTHEIVQELTVLEKQVNQQKAELAKLRETRTRLADISRIQLEAKKRCGLVEQKKYVLPVLSEFRSLVKDDRRESGKRIHE